MYLNEFLPMSF